MPTCQTCGNINPSSARFCDDCGSQFAPAGGGASGVIRIGREDDNDIVLPIQQLQVGRYHAQVGVDGGGNLTIEDLSSSNGTFVNGKRINRQTPFGLSDRVRFGSYRFNTALVRPYLTGERTPAARKPVQPTVQADWGGAPSPQHNPAMPAAVGGIPMMAQPVHAVPVAYAPVMPMAIAPGVLRHPAFVIVMSFLTLGLYNLYWWWVTLDDIRRWRGGQGWGGPMVLCAFIPFIGIIVLAIPFLIPSYVGDLYLRDGRLPPVTGFSGLWVFLPLLGHIIYVITVQGALNDYWRSKGAMG